MVETSLAWSPSRTKLERVTGAVEELHQKDHGIIMKVKVTQSCLTLCNPMAYSPWNSLGQNTGVGSLFLLQGIFPTQASNPGLLHCKRILYQLSHQGSPWGHQVSYKCFPLGGKTTVNLSRRLLLKVRDFFFCLCYFSVGWRCDFYKSKYTADQASCWSAFPSVYKGPVSRYTIRQAKLEESGLNTVSIFDTAPRSGLMELIFL